MANAQTVKGDMNGDGKLTPADITAIVDHILKGTKEYVSSGVTTANSELMKTWYNTKVDYITFNSTSVKYGGVNYSKYAYYPALNVIHIYGSEGSVKHTLIVKAKTSDSMTLLLPEGYKTTYYTTCPAALVEKITLAAGSTSLYTAYTAKNIPAETTVIEASVSPDFADNKEVEWTITQDMSTTKSITKVESTGNSITVKAARIGGATIIATAKDGSGVTASIHIDSKSRPTPTFVDLGLSVKWATFNVGANSPEEYGNYYAWGATKPQSVYEWVNAPYQTQNTTILENMKWTKYLGSTSSAYKDASATDADALKTVLDIEDDAAHVNWGGDWRMPTIEEQEELFKKCYWKWVTSYNGKSVNGYIVYKAKSDSDKGKRTNENNNPSLVGSYSISDPHIFLPAAGSRANSSLYYAGTYGDYWSSSLNKNNSNGAWTLYLNSKDFGNSNTSRSAGQSVRPVCP